MTDTLKENAWGIGLTLIGTGIGVLLSKAAGAVIIIAGLALIIWKETHKPRSRKKQERGLPENRPRVLPVAYGEESGAWGLTVANPGYDATDVHVPPVVIAWSGYTLIFGERVSLLTERDHHRFIVARLVHPTQSGLGGDQLVAVMKSAGINTLPFAIWFKDSDSRQYKGNCEIQRDANARGGLTVKFHSQELVAGPL